MEFILGKDIVEDLLPQKAPFAMADKLYASDKNSTVVGFTVPADNIFVEDGQFTEPGIIEHMAQSVALNKAYQAYLENQTPPKGYIGSIKDLKIIKLPSVGDKLITTIGIVQEFMGITLVNIEATANGTTIATCQMKTVLAK